MDVWPGGAITISDGTTLLASGSFTNGPTVIQFAPGGTFDFAAAVGIDVKNQRLLNFFGLPNTPFGFNYTDQFTTPTGQDPPNAFSSNQVFTGGAFINRPVSEPASLGLLAAGLLGLGTVLRKKLFAR